MKINSTLVKLAFVALPALSCAVTIAAHTMGRPRLDDAAVVAQADRRPPSEPRLDPNLHDQLLQALNPPYLTVPHPARDPFVDRAQLNKTAGRSPSASARPALFNPSGGPGAPTPAPGSADADGRPLKPFTERYRELQRAAAAARDSRRQAPPVTSIYSINEIEVYGRAAGGGVWVYGKPEDRAFTVAAGSQFLDAVFVGFEGDEAVFRTNKGRTVRLTVSRENS